MVLSRNTVLVAIGILLFAVGGYLYFGGDRDERAIRSQLSALVETVEKEGAVSKFESLGRARKFKGIFAEDPYVEYLPGSSLPSRSDAIQAGFLSVWSQIDTASIRVTEHEIDVKDGRTEAVSTFYANCKVVMNGSQKMSDTVYYRLYWLKLDGEWLIERIIAENTA
ncbi:MAG: nuclear transport factor 2 family protein [Opitutaceae bacterium]